MIWGCSHFLGSSAKTSGSGVWGHCVAGGTLPQCQYGEAVQLHGVWFCAGGGLKGLEPSTGVNYCVRRRPCCDTSDSAVMLFAESVSSGAEDCIVNLV